MSLDVQRVLPAAVRERKYYRRISGPRLQGRPAGRAWWRWRRQANYRTQIEKLRSPVGKGADPRGWCRRIV